MAGPDRCRSDVAREGGTSFDALFEEADAIRTSKPERFFRVLKQLEALEEASTPDQRMKIRLMRAHGFLLEGKAEAAIRDLEEIRTARPTLPSDSAPGPC